MSAGQLRFENVGAQDEKEHCRTVLQGASAVGPNPLQEGSVLQVSGSPSWSLVVGRCYSLTGSNLDGVQLADSGVYLNTQRGMMRFRIDNQTCNGCP